MGLVGVWLLVDGLWLWSITYIETDCQFSIQFSPSSKITRTDTVALELTWIKFMSGQMFF